MIASPAPYDPMHVDTGPSEPALVNNDDEDDDDDDIDGVPLEIAVSPLPFMLAFTLGIERCRLNATPAFKEEKDPVSCGEDDVTDGMERKRAWCLAASLFDLYNSKYGRNWCL